MREVFCCMSRVGFGNQLLAEVKSYIDTVDMRLLRRDENYHHNPLTSFVSTWHGMWSYFVLFSTCEA
jgi:hypothetical protein